MRTYMITDLATGQIIGAQTIADQFSPILLNGQKATVVPVGFAVDTGSLSAVGPDPTPITLYGDFNVTLTGAFVASVTLERSFDGSTWIPVTLIDGSPITLIADSSLGWTECEQGVKYRLRCTYYTSGTVTWRISQ